MSIKSPVRAAASLVCIASDAGGFTAASPAQAQPRKKPHISHAWLADHKDDLVYLKADMYGALGFHNAANATAQGQVNRMRELKANPDQWYLIPQVKEATGQAREALSGSTQEVRDRNNKNVKQFRRQFIDCFTPKGRKAFEEPVHIVKGGFRDLAAADEKVLLGMSDISISAEADTGQKHLDDAAIDALSGEGSMDNGLVRLQELR